MKTSLNEEVAKIQLDYIMQNLLTVKKLACKFGEIISIIHENMIF